MEGVFSSEEDEGENDMLSGIHSSDDDYKPLRQVAKKKKGNVNKKMVSTYAKSFGKRMQKYQEFAQASKLGHKISDVTKPLRPSDLTDYTKTKFGHRITYERKTGMGQKRFLKSNLNPAKKAKLEREGWTFVPPSNPGSVTKTYSAKKVHQVKPLRQSFRAELDTFMGYEEGREGDNVNYVGGSEDQVWPLTQLFLFPFCKNSLICLEGKSMNPHRGNTILFRSSQQLPRLRLGPSKGFLS